MVQSFGKKRKSRKSRKVAVKKSTMYCIKRTKAGKRVVKVEVTQKGKKVVKKYASTKRAIGKNVKCFRTKTQAKASLKQLKSGFGARKSMKKTVRPYGFVACNNQEEGGKPFKVYKFYPIKYNYETYKIVVHKDRYTGETKAFHVPQEAKLYRVKTSGSESQRKASERLARAKAAKKAAEYETLGAVGVDLRLVECNPSEVEDMAKTAGAPAAVKTAAKNPFQESMRQASRSTLSGAEAGELFKNASQVSTALQRSNMDSLHKIRGQRMISTRSIGDYLMGGRIGRATGSGRIPVSDGKFRTETGSTQPNFGRSLFGRRVNYGFSKYF